MRGAERYLAVLFIHLQIPSSEKYGKLVGFNENFTILDESDAQGAIGIIRAKLGYNKNEKRFPLKHTIAAVLSKSVNKNAPIEFILNTEYPHFMGSLDSIKVIQMEYQKYKKKNTDGLR